MASWKALANHQALEAEAGGNFASTARSKFALDGCERLCELAADKLY